MQRTAIPRNFQGYYVISLDVLRSLGACGSAIHQFKQLTTSLDRESVTVASGTLETLLYRCPETLGQLLTSLGYPPPGSAATAKAEAARAHADDIWRQVRAIDIHAPISCYWSAFLRHISGSLGNGLKPFADELIAQWDTEAAPATPTTPTHFALYVDVTRTQRVRVLVEADTPEEALETAADPSAWIETDDGDDGAFPGEDSTIHEPEFWIDASDQLIQPLISTGIAPGILNIDNEFVPCEPSSSVVSG